MAQKRYWRVVGRGAVAVGILLALSVLLFFGELRRARSETDALLSDVFAVVLSKVPASQGNFQIIIMREAERPGAEPGDVTTARWNLLSDEKLRFPNASFITRTSFLVTNALPTELRVSLHLPKGAQSVVISNSDLEHMTRSEFMRRFPDDLSWEQLSVSQPGFNFKKTEAILYANHYCAGLCGGGEYILLRKVDGVWRIVEQHSTWVS